MRAFCLKQRCNGMCCRGPCCIYYSLAKVESFLGGGGVREPHRGTLWGRALQNNEELFCDIEGWGHLTVSHKEKKQAHRVSYNPCQLWTATLNTWSEVGSRFTSHVLFYVPLLSRPHVEHKSKEKNLFSNTILNTCSLPTIHDVQKLHLNPYLCNVAYAPLVCGLDTVEHNFFFHLYL